MSKIIRSKETNIVEFDFQLNMRDGKGFSSKKGGIGVCFYVKKYAPGFSFVVKHLSAPIFLAQFKF